MAHLTGSRRSLFVLALLLTASVLGCQTEPASPLGEASSAAPADSAPPVALRDTITLTGTLIDATCHAQEAEPVDACEGRYVQAGYPVGVRVGAVDDSVWILVAVPQALGDYLRATARVTGRVRSDGILIPHRMAVRNGSTWTAIM